MSEVITSPSNERIKAIRALAEPRGRRREGRYVVEGVRLVEAALDAGGRPVLVLVNPQQLAVTERGRGLLVRLSEFSTLTVSERAMRAAATTENPQGVLAVMPLPRPSLSRDLGSIVLVVDRVRDPGNLGTILRSAEACGLVRTVFVEDCVDPFGPKVVRAGMGAHFRLDVFEDLAWERLREVLAGRPVQLATADADRSYDDVDWTQDAALIVGGEAEGAGAEARALATETVAIPMAGQAESLNAAIAASVILFEAARQRRAACRT